MYLLGIDLGTTGCKSILFNQKVEIVSEAYIEYPVIRTAEGWIEQDADLWWELVKNVVREVVSKPGIDSKDIAALSISSQGISFVPVDRNGDTVGNAISWLDRRAYEQEGYIENCIGKEEIYQRTGKRLNLTYSLPKIMWMKENCPEVYKRTWKLLMGLDFLTFRLTGVAVTDHSMAGGTMAYNIVRRDWDDEILRKCGIERSILPELAYVGQPIGKVLPEVARETGLSADTLVVLGAQDQKCAAIGAGIKNGVCTVSLGTASAISCISTEPLLDKEMRMPCFVLDEKRWILEAVISTAGVSLKWIKNTLFKEESYPEIDKIVEGVLPGAGGVFFYPHLEGAASPYWKPGSKGFIYGLNISTSSGELLRALYEGVAYQIRANMEVIERLGRKPEEIRLFGGGSKSGIWCRIIADITGIPVSTLYTSETANLGAAIIAGIGCGMFESGDNILSQIKLVEKTYLPDKTEKEKYSAFYERYCKIQKKVLSDIDES